MPRGGALRNTWQAAHAYSTLPPPYTTRTYTAHTYNSHPLPGLAHWTDIKVSALGSRVGWTPARNNELTNERGQSNNGVKDKLSCKMILGFELHKTRRTRSVTSYSRFSRPRPIDPQCSLTLPVGLLCFVNNVSTSNRLYARWLNDGLLAKFCLAEDCNKASWFFCLSSVCSFYCSCYHYCWIKMNIKPKMLAIWTYPFY